MLSFSIYDKLEDFMSVFSSYKKIFLLGFIIVILIAIPFSVYIAQKRQNITSKATASTTLSFEPTSTTTKIGDTVSLNIWLDPGSGTDANMVSFVKLSIKFDQTKFQTIADSLTSTLTPIDPAQYDNTAGTATISLSIGADPANAIKTKTKIAILKLKATATTTPIEPNVEFVTTSDSTQVLSIDSGSQTSDNVLKLSTTSPATVTVNAAEATQTPSPAAIDGAIPICSGLNIDRSASGTAPYSLTFTATGSDPDGTINKATFNFADGPIQDVTTGGGIGTNSVDVQISHTYNNAGTYTAYAILSDNDNNLSEQQAGCTKTITVSQASGGTGGNLAIGGSLTTGGNLPTQTIDPAIAPEIMPPQITLPPTGPGDNILKAGIIGVIFVIIGGALLLL